MFDCANVEMRELLPDLVAGTLDAATRARVERHHATCAECASGSRRSASSAWRSGKRPTSTWRVSSRRFRALVPPPVLLLGDRRRSSDGWIGASQPP